MRGWFRGLHRNVVGLGLASFFTDLASEMITPLIPLFLTRELRAGAVLLGWMEGVADSVASLLRLISGWISDRAKKRKIFILVGYGFSVVVRPLTAVVRVAWQLLALRLVDRIGKGIRLAPRDALIADSCDAASRGRAFGLQKMMDNMGGVAGMLIAAAILGWITQDLRMVFLITAIPAACVLVVVAFAVKDVPPTVPAAKLQVSFKPFGADFRWFLFAITVFTLGNSSDLFILLQLSRLGLEDRWIPLVWAGHTMVRMLAALPAGVLADRVGKKRIVLLGWWFYVFVYAALAYTTSLAVAFVLVAIYALYWSLGESMLRAIVADMVPDHLRGTAYGTFHFCVGLAILPANLLFGYLYFEFGARPAFLVGAAFAAVAWIMLAMMKKAGKAETPPRPV